MKNQIKNNKSAGQSAVDVRKPQKHDANLQKNSTLYFQIGLILCLLGTFALFEMQFKATPLEVAQNDPADETVEVVFDKYKIYEPQVKPEPKVNRTTKLIDTFVEKDDDYVETKLKDIVTPDNNVTSDKPPVKVEDVTVIEIPEDVPVNSVQFVPVFPGCEKFELNSKRKKCLNEKMGKLVKRKFNTGIAQDHGLNGLQRIFVEFKVSKTGEILDIKARAPHPKLEAEALRIASKIPNMIPGKMGDEPVNVIYNLPITFKVQN